LAFLSDQRKTIGQTSKVVIKMEDQNFILLKNEEVVSPRNWTCDKEEDSEDCIEFLEEISSEMADFWHELSLLENRLANQRMKILIVQLKLDEGEADVSHAKEESVLELKEAELITRISQGAEGQLWSVVKKEEECYAGNEPYLDSAREI